MVDTTILSCDWLLQVAGAAAGAAGHGGGAGGGAGEGAGGRGAEIPREVEEICSLASSVS